MAFSALLGKALPNIIGAIGGMGSAAIGKIGNSSAKAAKLQYDYNSKLQKQQQEWNEYMYRNRYQMQVEDLEKAGINKLYGLGTAPSVSSGLNSVGMPDTVNEKQGNRQLALNTIETIQNFSAKRAEIEKTKQETQTEKHNTSLRALQTINQMYENQIKLKDTKNYDARFTAELEEQRSRIIKNLADEQKARKDAEFITENTTTAKRINKWHEEHPTLSKISTGTGEMSDLAKVVAGAVGGFAVTKGLPKRRFSARRR